MTEVMELEKVIWIKLAKMRRKRTKDLVMRE